MKRTLSGFLAGITATLLVIGPILLVWVRNEREDRCKLSNQNIASILTVAQVTRDFMDTFVNVLVSFADPDDPEAQANVEVFLDSLQPAFDRFDEAVSNIQFVEC